MEWTAEEVDRLVSLPKNVTDPPRRDWKEERGSRRKDLRAESLDGRHRFRVFARVNLRFEENFSLGLCFLPRGEGEVPLIRCNGPHGRNVAQGFVPDEPHFGHHVHRLTADDALAGVMVERSASRTEEFATFDEAVHWFARNCGIPDLPALLGTKSQMEMFPEKKP